MFRLRAVLDARDVGFVLHECRPAIACTLPLDGGEEREPWPLEVFLGEIGVEDIGDSYANHRAAGDDLLRPYGAK